MVEKQLKKLLFRFDCVILPDFGAFLAKNKPSQFHKSTQAFYPPQRQLNFNAQLKSDDGLLIKSISKANNISYDQAKYEVNSFVADLKHTLDEEKSVTFDHLGSFELNNDKILKFTPDQTSLRKDTFGLKALQLDQIAQDEKEIDTQVSNKQTGVIHLENDRQQTKTHKAKPLLKYASIAVLAIALTSWIGYSLYQTQHTNSSDTSQTQQVSIEKKLQTANFELQESLPALTLKLEQEQNQPQSIPKKYHIIAGAFRDKQNADKKVKQLQNKGFESQLLGVNKYGLHQVSFESYASRNKSLKALKSIKQEENENAWLLIQEF